MRSEALVSYLKLLLQVLLRAHFQQGTQEAIRYSAHCTEKAAHVHSQVLLPYGERSCFWTGDLGQCTDSRGTWL